MKNSAIAEYLLSLTLAGRRTKGGASSGARDDRKRRTGEAGIAWIPVILIGAVGSLAAGLLTGDIWGPIRIVVENLALVADSVVNMLPDAEELDLGALNGWAYGFSVFDTFLPLTEALGFVAIFIAIALAQLAWRTAVTIYHLIPKPGAGT